MSEAKPDRGSVWKRLGAPTDQQGSVNDPRTQQEQGLTWNEKWIYRGEHGDAVEGARGPAPAPAGPLEDDRVPRHARRLRPEPPQRTDRGEMQVLRVGRHVQGGGEGDRPEPEALAAPGDRLRTDLPRRVGAGDGAPEARGSRSASRP